MTAAATLRPGSLAELTELLRSRPGRVRLLGSGSHQARLPAVADAVRVSLAALDRIDRLDPEDQTCSVDCGVPRAALDAALAEHDLELPCPGDGTVGGLFAADPIGAATPAGHSPRSLLLGVAALLADGRAFQSGARVVKSVAGFDVHKLLVGSHGRLFIATRLHLRVRPRPVATEWFAHGPDEAGAALELLRRLRAEPVPPAALQLERTADGSCWLGGAIAGRASHVAAALRRLDLRPAARRWRDQLPAPRGGEVVAALVLPSQLADVLDMLPAATCLLWHGGGRAELSTPQPAATDVLLEGFRNLAIPADVVIGSDHRLGRGTPADTGEQRLASGIKLALDPDGVLV